MSILGTLNPFKMKFELFQIFVDSFDMSRNLFHHHFLQPFADGTTQQHCCHSADVPSWFCWHSRISRCHRLIYSLKKCGCFASAKTGTVSRFEEESFAQFHNCWCIFSWGFSVVGNVRLLSAKADISTDSGSICQCICYTASNKQWLTLFIKASTVNASCQLNTSFLFIASLMKHFVLPSGFLHHCKRAFSPTFRAFIMLCYYCFNFWITILVKPCVWILQNIDNLIGKFKKTK